MTRKCQVDSSFHMSRNAAIGIVFLIFLSLPGYLYAHSGGLLLGVFLLIYALAYLIILVFSYIPAAFLAAYVKSLLLKIKIIKSLNFSSKLIKRVALYEIVLMTLTFLVLSWLVDLKDLEFASNFLMVPDTLAIWYKKIITNARFPELQLSYSKWCIILFFTIPFYFPFSMILNYFFLWKKNNPNTKASLPPITFSTIFSLIMPVVLIPLTIPLILSNPFPKENELNSMMRSALVLSHEKLYSALVKKGVDLNYIDKNGKTALMLPFSSNGYTSWKQDEFIKVLIENGADVNARDYQGNTPLMHVCKFNWRWHRYQTVGSKCIDLLINKGADINAKNNIGRTALMIAIDHDRNVAKQLIQNGADVNAKDNEGRTALMTEFRSWYDTRGMALLLKNGADVNVKDNKGRTALMIQKSPKMANLLFEAGADINAKDNDGNTALMIAAANIKLHPAGRIEMVKFLVFKDAEINAKNNSGKTALMATVSTSKANPVEPLEIVKFLVSHGADVDLKDRDGNTALELAKARGHLRSVNLLQTKGSKGIKSAVDSRVIER